MPLIVLLLLSVFFNELRAAPCHLSFRRELENRSLKYFLDNAHPKSGLIRDRANNFVSPFSSTNDRMASLSATGFGIAIFANASERGLISKQEATERIFRTLHFVKDYLFRYQGWLYHFVDWETGYRYRNSEISTIDTALFFAGALYAAHELQSPEMIQLVSKLFNEINFTDMMTDGNAHPEKRTLSMGWLPESGYLAPQWDHYAEHLAMIIMGMGSETHPLPAETWQAWRRIAAEPPISETIFGKDLSLFTHQYSHLFIDFRKIATPDEDFHMNSRLATLKNQEFCQSQSHQFHTFKEGFWGLSASDSPSGYAAFSPAYFEGTVCPGCVGGSAMFLECPILAQLENWATGPYRTKLWGAYGFSDSLNVDKKWYDDEVIGITVGALYLSLANTDSQSPVWKTFHNIPEIKRGIQKVNELNSPRRPLK